MAYRLTPLALAALLAAAPWTPAAAQAADAASEPDRPEDRGTWSFTLENDLFGSDDKNYTNGVRLDYVRPRNDLSAVGRLGRRALPEWFSDADEWYEIYTLGQNMYTPSDISLARPPRDERPYSGFLYAGFGLAADRGDRLDTLAVEVGVVGPASLAGRTQTLVHEILQVQEPKGWDTQLENEPAIRVVYERKWRYAADVPLPLVDLSVDWAPHFNLALGNVDTSLGLGGTVRLGEDLDDGYGPPRVRPAVGGPGFFQDRDGFSWYVFAGAEARAVGRNIFIEGNTFGGVDGVEPNRVVGDLQAGIALQFGRVELAFTQVLRSEEYRGQDGPSVFGSLNLRARF